MSQPAGIQPPLIVSIPSYAALADGIARETGYQPGGVVRKTFSDGEVYQRLETPVLGRDVVLVAGTASDPDTLLAYDLACAAVLWGAARLTWVVPYFGYQTMERAVRTGEAVTAKTRASLMSAVPPSPGGNRVVLLDLHAPGIPHYFADPVRAFHVYGKELVFEAVRAFAGSEAPVLAAPDAGRAKWVQSLADELGVDVALAYKRRLADGQVRLTGVDAQVQGRTVVIYDDMVRTGSTLVEAAQAFRQAGARRVFAVTTHLVLPDGALERLLGSGVLDGLAGTDSHPRARAASHPGLVVRSVDRLLARWLRES